MSHGAQGGLCSEDHFCSSCVAGGSQESCYDLFIFGDCGMVACTFWEVR